MIKLKNKNKNKNKNKINTYLHFCIKSPPPLGKSSNIIAAYKRLPLCRMDTVGGVNGYLV